MNRPLDAHSFSKPLDLSARDNDIYFGISPGNAAAVLRQFADAIDAKQIYIHKVVTYQKADNGDFAMSALILNFAQTFPKQKEEPVALHGNGPIPVAVVKQKE